MSCTIILYYVPFCGKWIKFGFSIKSDMFIFDSQIWIRIERTLITIPLNPFINTSNELSSHPKIIIDCSNTPMWMLILDCLAASPSRTLKVIRGDFCLLSSTSKVCQGHLGGSFLIFLTVSIDCACSTKCMYFSLAPPLDAHWLLHLLQGLWSPNVGHWWSLKVVWAEVPLYFLLFP